MKILQHDIIPYKYNNKLPVISNVKYNQYLKVIAQAAGIDKPVSTLYACIFRSKFPHHYGMIPKQYFGAKWAIKVA